MSRWVFGTFLALAATGAAATTLSVHVDRTEVVLGSSVNLEVTSVAPGDVRPLDALSLDALDRDFEVRDVSRGTRRGAGQTRQSLTASLYPRRAGRLVVPALQVPGARSAPIDISVRETGPDRGRVFFRAGIEPEQPSVREGALLYLDIYDSNDFAWTAPEPRAGAGVHLRALADARRRETLDGATYTVHRYAWAATALRDGVIEIGFETLRARYFGQRLRYSAPPFRYAAQPVPAWLPVIVPVGAPELRAASLPDEWPVGRPFNWQFEISGAGLSANGLKQLLAATLGAGRGVRLYAPVVELVERPDARDPRQTFRVTIPVQAPEDGVAALPPLRLPYFDAQRDRLDMIELPGATLVAVSPARLLAWRVGAVLLAVLIAAGIARHGAVAWRRLRRRRARAARVQRAQSAREIKSALLDVDGVPPCPTLRRWRQRAGVRADSELAVWIEQLERACYAGRDADVAALKSRARRLLRA